MRTAASASLAAEREVLRAVVYHPECLAEVEDLPAEAFVHPGHQALWRIALELEAAGNLTSDSFYERAIAAGDAFERVFVEVAEHALAIGLSSNVQYHANIVREQALSRRVALVLSDLLRKHQDADQTGTELLETALCALHGLERARPGEVIGIRDLVKRRLREHDEAFAARQRGEIVGYVPTGIEDLDKMAFLRPGVVTALAARPGMGKSAIAQQIATGAADAGVPVHFISLEDGWASFTDRMLARAALGRITLSQQRAHRLNTGQLGQLVQAGMEIVQRRDGRLLFSSLTGKTARECIAVARRVHRRHGTKLVVVDYLHKLKRPDPRMSLFEGYGANCSDLEDAAKEHDWAVIALCQVNRDVEKRPDKRPRLEDIYGSDAVGQYVKAGIGLYREAVYDDTADERRLEFIGIKNNDGPAHWSFCVGWDGPTTRIYPWPG